MLCRTVEYSRGVMAHLVEILAGTTQAAQGGGLYVVHEDAEGWSSPGLGVGEGRRWF